MEKENQRCETLYKRVVNAAKEAIKEAETSVPSWVKSKIKKSIDEEKEVASNQLNNILKNINIASEKNKPLCQDTGIPIFFLRIGTEFPVNFPLRSAFEDAMELATEEIPLRPSIVNPFNRKNSGNNVGDKVPILNTEIVEGSNSFEITAFPKGAGSENLSKQWMLLPDEVNDIDSYIVDAVDKAGGKPCPPLILGIGIGGSFDYSTNLAKKALIGEPNTSDGCIGSLEDQILAKVNSLGIGPMGIGGKTTCLGVSIETASCHTASLPVALNIQCWASRTATKVLEV